MQYSTEIQSMCPVQRGDLHPSAPIPVEGRMIRPTDVIAISGLSHGVAHAPRSKVRLSSPLISKRASSKKHSSRPLAARA